jgi:hypothetical protein
LGTRLEIAQIVIKDHENYTKNKAILEKKKWIKNIKKGGKKLCGSRARA